MPIRPDRDPIHERIANLLPDRELDRQHPEGVHAELPDPQVPLPGRPLHAPDQENLQAV